MFEQSFVAPGKSRREQTIVLALGLQALAVTALVIAPLTRVESIEAGKRFVILPPTILVDEPAKLLPKRATASVAPRQFVLPTRTTPAPTIPHAGPLVPSDAPILPSAGATSVNAAGIPGSEGLGIPGPPVAQYVAPPRPKEKTPPAPVRVGIGVSQSQLEFGPKPPYPQLALISRVEGTVKLQAIISREGRVENLHVLSGHPLLIRAAVEAVRQWRYRPLLLNGEPIEVITEIDVNFTLRQ